MMNLGCVLPMLRRVKDTIVRYFEKLLGVS
jgi:hypothetical protein